MNKNVLQMKYHPAKKEVEFRRFQNGEEITIRNDSRLMHYMKQRGKFVLQDHGNQFFDDIVTAFDGLESVEMQVITTKLDYEDLIQMIEYYNEEAGEKCKINPTLLAELPDMVRTFEEVKKFGEEAAGVLQSHRHKMFEISLTGENVKKSAENFATQIEVEVKNIKEKIKGLGDNNVSLCFTGVFSSGKSALINAILGYRILPENITSETAKMFQINSPGQGEKVKVKFCICNMRAELEWNEEAQSFEFLQGPSEDAIRAEIQEKINGIKGECQHVQLNKILSYLNNVEEISSDILVRFPIPLDTRELQFTIYDTPGTDSNFQAHQNILRHALAEQEKSILIFVGKPDGLEGTGNSALLNYLKEADEKTNKTSIDIGRSLFIINKADTVSEDSRITLQNQKITNKDDDAFSIKLADKKLFFVSALYAYAAKAVKSGIATVEEKNYLEAGKTLLASEKMPMAFCYRQNRCATSEFATRKMMEKCEEALADAREKSDEPGELLVCSGLYALEKEIVQYGEKFASAVKAFAIIQSVEKAMAKLRNRADSLLESNQKEISNIQAEIDELRKTINEAIDAEYKNMTVPENGELPIATIEQLRLDTESYDSEIVQKAKQQIDKLLKRTFFGLGKVKPKDKDKEKVKNTIGDLLTGFTDEFLVKRKKLLEMQRDEFIAAIQDTIMKNGSISESAKKYFLDIPKATIPTLGNVEEVGNMYDSARKVDKFLVFKTEYLDKEKFSNDIQEKLIKIGGIIHDEYKTDYINALETLLAQIKHQFGTNLEEYSVQMKAMMEDMDAMMQLGGKVSDAAQDLAGCQENLNRIIWKEINNG